MTDAVMKAVLAHHAKSTCACVFCPCAQVEGKNGIPALMSKIQKGGPSVLYHGALAASAATFVGHYPWFAVVSVRNIQ